MKVVRKLMPDTPSRELVEAYLSEIAKAYGVAWAPATRQADISGSGDDEDKGEGGVQVYIRPSLLS
jgi:vacuolar protein sorting-associated protein IST1